MRDFRVIAVDDSPFSRFQKKVVCAGVVARGAVVEGIFSFAVARDGFDATQQIISAVRASRLGQGAKLVLLEGIALAGLNLVDISGVSRSLGVPVIALTANKPREGEMKKAIEAAGSARKRMNLFEKAGPMQEFVAGGKKLYAQFAGAGRNEVSLLLFSFAGFPEPLRLAHLVAGVLK